MTAAILAHCLRFSLWHGSREKSGRTCPPEWNENTFMISHKSNNERRKLGTKLQAEECKSSQLELIRRLQQTCRHENDNLLKFEMDHDYNQTCSALYMVYKCIASNIFDCNDAAMKNFEHYYHSPTSCSFTADQTLLLQDIKIKSEQAAKAKEKNEITIPPVEGTTSSLDHTEIVRTSTLARNNSFSSKEEHKGQNSHNGASNICTHVSTSLLLALVLILT
ncbi:uncharacterized protein LOC131932637 [Physella acuta]|uniref:uncharacterized protein LOC131932637 n=1 Tax=Physella acuta TaxID=109671 RepID=UPI0027DB9A5C|nr:uncharacterized protein LOC131932637 [Physella acuta]